MNQKQKHEIIELLQSIPDEWKVIEDKIGMEEVSEYYELVEKLEGSKPLLKNILLKFKEGWRKVSSLEDRKIWLVFLSNIGTVKSYRTIEEIKMEGGAKIQDFAQVALKFARLNLENQLVDDPIGFISSGLGGKGKNLRYYLVFTSVNQISEAKEKFLLKKSQEVFRSNMVEVESCENHGYYVLLKILVSIDLSIQSVVDKFTTHCLFLDKEYLCTNVEKPTKDFVKRWIDGKFDEEMPPSFE